MPMNREQAEALAWRFANENQRDRTRGDRSLVLSDLQARQLRPMNPFRDPGESVQPAKLTDDELRVLLPEHYRDQFVSAEAA